MKTLTPPLIRFALVAVGCTAGFRVALSSLLTQGHFNFVVPVAILFGLVMFLAGRYFGRRDNEYLPIYDVGFRFHLVTFLQYHIVSYGWYWFGFPSVHEHIGALNATLIIWGICLAVHAYYYVQARRHTIKHINRDELFD
ncbi:hypothetical protein BC792_10423 [Sphingobacterium allocomposti]|uniref:Uncharacterized protein n=1 Tax=Sphingobacterium allocomposti TaxID=415956 RepID=A0A5S5DPP4_9SPHI|nr:hypothetical protein [Sphingobacterium composti Yoo et al. 2007 non Ten et al. 2007]TYP96802.1 hypothetical protein BC792_10423 [Sphingobacterium composti Yoo et al. 2007 non Ten et al. 2007]